jgi:hypothetical protein
MNTDFRGKRGARAAFAAAGVAAALAGCATPDQIATQVTKANLAIETSNNQMLVLNVLRAYKRRPMYFSAMTQILGPTGIASPTVSLKIPFGPDFTNNIYESSAQFAGDVPRFTVGSLDTQKFMRGIMTPVEPATIKYYLDQGWPKRLLLTLFIREIRIHTGTSEEDAVPAGEPFANVPGNAGKYERFRDELSKLADCDLDLVSSAVPRAVGPTLSHGQAARLADLVGAAKEKFSVAERKDKPGTYQLTTRTHEWKFAFRRNCENSEIAATLDRPRKRGDAPASDGGGAAAPGTAATTDRRQTLEMEIRRIAPVERAGDDPERRTPPRTDEPRKTWTTVYFRSPEAILYFLGEVVRAQMPLDPARKRYVPRVITRDDPVDPFEEIFVLKTRAEAHDLRAAISVDYDGESYVVPDRESGGGRSMHVLSLVTQLIGLQKEAGELPFTGTVRVVP